MNLFTSKKLAAGLAVCLFLPVLSALAAPEERWLFVFDTSAAMKKRLPAVEAEIKNIFSSSLEGRLRTGDSLGVWTFDQELHLGQFPLTTWTPENAVSVTTNLFSFLRRQRYMGDTTFGALQPILNRVIQDSERLTLVIFCDGSGTVNWTPYDDGINEAMHSVLEERKKTRQPVVLVLRTQLGKFIGCTVNYPPTPLNIPPFTPFPVEKKAEPPIPTNPPVAVKPPAPTPSALIIVGTAVSTDTNNIPKYQPPPTNAITSSLLPTNPIPGSSVKTNAPISVPPVVAIAPTIAPAVKPPIAPSLAPPADPVAATATNESAAPTASGENGTRLLTFLGAGLLGAAIALVLVLMARRRRPHASLITSSMTDLPPPPRKKD